MSGKFDFCKFINLYCLCTFGWVESGLIGLSFPPLSSTPFLRCFSPTFTSSPSFYSLYFMASVIILTFCTLSYPHTLPTMLFSDHFPLRFCLFVCALPRIYANFHRSSGLALQFDTRYPYWHFHTIHCSTLPRLQTRGCTSLTYTILSFCPCLTPHHPLCHHESYVL